jgi:signal transduction histidine kinase
MASLPEWLVVLRANGRVESVEGAPEEWRGKKIADVEAPNVIKRAVNELLEETEPYVRRRKVKTDEALVELLLVEAVPLRRTPSAASDLVMRTLDLFATQAKTSKIDLTVESEPGVPPTLRIDGEKIAWALATLIANALRYAREHVRVRLSAESNEVVINVSDDGPGIPEEKLKWLFERDPASGQSVGLALPMVRDVMAAHRGSVHVQSLPGRGTRFTLRLPA